MILLVALSGWVLYRAITAQLYQVNKTLAAIRQDVAAIKYQVEFEEKQAALYAQLREETAKANEIAKRLKETGFYDGAGTWYPPGSEFPK
jgi:hypothetical protein